MALPASGEITMAQINAEFGRGNDLNSYRGTTWYTDAGGSGTFSSGAISMSDFYGKRATSPTFTATISTHYDQLNLRSWAISNGWNGSSAAIITLASGYYIYSSNTGAAALTIDGSWAGGLTFINNGYIMGMGGHGGGARQNSVTDYSSNYEQSGGGAAISMGVSCTIQNNAYIGGGGGGGAGGIWQGGGYVYAYAAATGGGGAGGGTGGNFWQGATPVVYGIGGSGGGIGGAGGDGSISSAVPTYATYPSGGGGGGRIMPSSRTSSPSASYGGGNATAGYGAEAVVAGGNQSIASSVNSYSTLGVSRGGGYGGTGGGSGAALSQTQTYNAATSAGGGGGGWGSSGGSARAIGTSANSSAGYAGEASFSGSAGGKCVNLNGYSITWSATGNRYGGIS